MFWKVLGGIVAFFVVVTMAVVLLATAGVTAAGVAVASVIDDLDIRIAIGARNEPAKV